MKSLILSFLMITALFGDFAKDGDVVRNDNNSLVYSDDAEASDSWSNAISYCENLVLDAEDDWRLPNIKELLFIMGGYPQRESSMPNKLNGAFTNKTANVNYWSSTTDKSSTDDAYLVNANNGTILTNSKANTNAIICIRGD